MSLLIRGAQLIDPANQLDAVSDIYISEGKITALGEATQSFKADNNIDATGLVACPGLIDLCARLPEPGFEHKGTIASETRAAAAGGITSLLCTPNTLPVIDSPSVATLIQDIAQQHGHARVLPVGALTNGLRGQQLSEMYALKQAGCVGVSNLRYPFESHRVLQHCLEYAASQDLVVFFSSVDQQIAQDGCVHDGRFATHMGLKGIPETAETVALSRDLLLVEQTGVRAHFGALSSGRSVELIAAAKQRGLKVSADVSIHHLMHTEEMLEGFDSLYHIQPPLRTAADRDALRQGLKEGVIDAIRSDHQPHETAAKMAPFAATEPGISSLETMLSQGLQLAGEMELGLFDLIQKWTLGPAAAVGLNSGSLGVGDIADLCLFDPDESWHVDVDSLLSQGHNTPLLNTTVQGRVRYTLLAGKRVYQAQR